MCKLGVKEWLVVQAMWANARSCEELVVKVGVHQKSVLAALSCEFSSGCPQELLYADDLVLIAKSMEELIKKFK